MPSLLPTIFFQPTYLSRYEIKSKNYLRNFKQNNLRTVAKRCQYNKTFEKICSCTPKNLCPIYDFLKSCLEYENECLEFCFVVIQNRIELKYLIWIWSGSVIGTSADPKPCFLLRISGVCSS